MQLALGAEGVDDSIGDDRYGARTLVESEVVAIVRGVCVAPDGRAGLGIERLEDFFVADAVKEQHPILDEGRSRKCLTDLLTPDDLRSRCAPCLGQWRTGIGPVALRSKDLWPIGGDDRCGNREPNQKSDGGGTGHVDDFTAMWPRLPHPATCEDTA